VQIPAGTSDAPNLKRLLTDPSIVKIFHFARFDLAAKFPEELPKNREKYNAALNAMMQKMLVERFKLAVHRDRKNLAVYGLVVGKHGIKMKEVPDGDSHSRSRNNHYEGSGMTMAGFAGFLSRRVDLPVLDMTGLKGFYELTLDWVPEARPGADRKGDVVAVADSATGPTIFIALEEQLGLKLETRKAPVEMLVVDRAEKLPTEN